MTNADHHDARAYTARKAAREAEAEGAPIRAERCRAIAADESAKAMAAAGR